MGIIVRRPEDPEDWGGLPAEPLEAPTGTEALQPAPNVLGLADATGVSLTSVTIPVPLPEADEDAEPEP